MTTLAGYDNAKGVSGFGAGQPDPFGITNPRPLGSPTSTGIFAYWAANGLQNITDGSSNTIAFTESLVGDAQPANGGRRNYAVLGVTAAATADVPDATALLASGSLVQALQACTTAYKSNTNVVNNPGIRWAWGAVGMTLFQKIVPPNSPQYPWNSCRTGCPGCSPDDSSYSNSQSNHPGGCNFLFADGSVKFIKSTVAMQTYMALGTRAGGEVISADQY